MLCDGVRGTGRVKDFLELLASQNPETIMRTAQEAIEVRILEVVARAGVCQICTLPDSSKTLIALPP